MPSSVSVVVPTYEEKDNIEALVRRLHAVLAAREHEIIIVDDASPDGTAAVVESLAGAVPNLRLLSRPKREGIGAALRAGLDAARNDVLVSMDSDLSYAPEDVLLLLRELEGNDLVLGCRHGEDGRYQAPTLRTAVKLLVSRTGNWLARRATGLSIRDYSSNFRAIRRAAWRGIRPRDNGNSFLFEMIWRSHAAGYRIAEIPVTFSDRRRGRSKLNLLIEAPRFLLRLAAHVGGRTRKAV